MNRVNLAGAITLLVVAAGYLAASLVAGHSAASHPPADLSASDRALGVYKTVALLVERQGDVVVLDTRSKEQFISYHLPGAVHLPNATSRQVLKAMGDRSVGLVVAPTDARAAELVGGAVELDSQKQLHFLQGGAQALYLTFELPVAAFTDKPAPFGYHASIDTVRAFLATGSTDRPQRVLDALTKLSSIEFAPSQLAGKKPKAAKKRKKIAGGCG